MEKYIYQAESVEKAIEMGLKDLNLTEDRVKIEVLQAASSGLFGFFKKEASVKLVPLDTEYKKEVVKKILPKSSAVPAELADKENAGNKIDAEQKNVAVEKIEEIPVVENISGEQVEVSEEKDFVEENSDKIEQIKVKREDIILKNKEEIVSYLKKIVHSMGFDTATFDFEVVESKIYSIRINDVENTSLLIGKRGNTLNSLQYLVNNFAKKYTNHFFRINLDCGDYREVRRKTLEELALNMAKKSKKLGKSVELEPMTSEERKIIHNALSGIKNVETLSQGKEPHRYLIITAW